MKIVRKNAIYVQKKDLKLLLNLLPNEATLPNSLFENLTSDVLMCQGQDKYTFVKVGKDCTEMFNKFDFMVDYDDVKRLNLEELCRSNVTMHDEIAISIKFFNEQTESYRKLYYANFKDKIKIKQAKIEDLEGYIDSCNGRIDYYYPAEIMEDKPIKSKKNKQKLKSIFTKK